MRELLVFLLMLAFFAAACDSDGPTGANREGGGEGITLLSSYEELGQVGGETWEIDFEQLPRTGSSCEHMYEHGPADSIPNPMVIDEVIFTDPHCLECGFCSYPTCRRDLDNEDGGNMVLTLNVDGVIEFPLNTVGALLVIEGIGETPFTLEVTDNAGDTLTVDGQGILFGVTHVSLVGFASKQGLKTVEVLSSGPTDGCSSAENCGPIVLSAVHVASGSVSSR